MTSRRSSAGSRQPRSRSLPGRFSSARAATTRNPNHTVYSGPHGSAPHGGPISTTDPASAPGPAPPVASGRAAFAGGAGTDRLNATT